MLKSSKAQEHLDGLTLDYLRSLLEYDPDTGVVTWSDTCGHWKAGQVAGSLVTSRDNYRCYNIGIDGVYHKLHRIIWFMATGEKCGHGVEIDHINGDGTDNRLANMRAVKHHDNLKNRTLQHNNKTGMPGVTITKIGNYHVTVGRRYVGRFDNLLDAFSARMSAQNKEDYHNNHGRCK